MYIMNYYFKIYRWSQETVAQRVDKLKLAMDKK